MEIKILIKRLELLKKDLLPIYDFSEEGTIVLIDQVIEELQKSNINLADFLREHCELYHYGWTEIDINSTVDRYMEKLKQKDK
jgi:hypothetical protein